MVKFRSPPALQVNFQVCREHLYLYPWYPLLQVQLDICNQHSYHNNANVVNMIPLKTQRIRDKRNNRKSFLDIYLKFNSNGQLSTRLYDKRCDFNFDINFPHLLVQLPTAPAYGVCMQTGPFPFLLEKPLHEVCSIQIKENTSAGRVVQLVPI